ELLRNISWLKDLDDKVFDELVEQFQNRIFSVDQQIISVDGKDEGLFVIIRGKVKVIVNKKVVDVLGPGDVVGEMALLTNQKRTATVTAESPTTTLWISELKIRKIFSLAPDIVNQLWLYASPRFAENVLSNKAPYNGWSQKQLRDWISKGECISMDKNAKFESETQQWILLTGEAHRTGDKSQKLKSPMLMEIGDVISSENSKIYVNSI
ncbi:MAG TPA: cyclic nucleotide-binding domain-containing protein, partial [Ignavibacteriaceae bacterium]